MLVLQSNGVWLYLVGVPTLLTLENPKLDMNVNNILLSQDT